MISFYSGTPGSGKSLNIARYIWIKVRHAKQNIILVNMTVNREYLITSKLKQLVNKIRLKLKLKPINTKLKDYGKIYSIRLDQLNTKFLEDYAMKFHMVGIEGQSKIIIDEAQLIWSPTVMKNKKQVDPNYRERWIEFMTLHRHLGFDMIIISQFDRLIDAQIRCLFEYNHIHRKVNNFCIGYWLNLFKIKVFAEVQYWYGVRARIGVNFFAITPWTSKHYRKIYNAHKRFSDLKGKKKVA
ncbi:hypothetical protein CACET_5p00060 (plasmid) [Clostridium aceticum]|uniref:Zona occludens toxin N-terminal domain-containing protein n=1 Tax=Clostridium aceticum TaxID=84022 RepID=A0A0D8I5M8_9CLOT|nr:zonular occludens toxin domain-containing protein [Clostridium aceticum]AKL97379.1 hypothetical protein CACET_5p00060 [Clostridium aceticum]KJF25600.1 hypothetical protein TZ02_17755 [Clostridium aceticum]